MFTLSPSYCTHDGCKIGQYTSYVFDFRALKFHGDVYENFIFTVSTYCTVVRIFKSLYKTLYIRGLTEGERESSNIFVRIKGSMIALTATNSRWNTSTKCTCVYTARDKSWFKERKWNNNKILWEVVLQDKKQEGVFSWHKIVMSTWCTLTETFFTVSEIRGFCATESFLFAWSWH